MIKPIFHCQPMAWGVKCPIMPEGASEIVRIPPSTKPPGQPACRMLSHFVLSLENIVATVGLITASTVPLPRARPGYRYTAANSPYAVRLQPLSLDPGGAKNSSAETVIITNAMWQMNAKTIDRP